MSREQTKTVLKRLDAIEDRTKRIYTVGGSIMPQGASMETYSYFAIGAMKRAVSINSAFGTMLRDWNMLVSRALLRMQIDTAVRFAAINLVNDPHEFAMHILGDKPIDQFKDRDGKRLTYTHLVDSLKERAPWLPEVYRRTSGYVHLSGANIWASVVQTKETEDTGLLWFAVTPEDTKYPEASWLEVAECLCQVNDMFIDQLIAYGRKQGGGSAQK